MEFIDIAYFNDQSPVAITSSNALCQLSRREMNVNFSFYFILKFALTELFWYFLEQCEKLYLYIEYIPTIKLQTTKKYGPSGAFIRKTCQTAPQTLYTKSAQTPRDVPYIYIIYNYTSSYKLFLFSYSFLF